ncbi:TPA: hypothetical protein N0F65_011380 [Lagenidium giganteum]|uniref:LicD/FKTN/FKRP nucleotidyltransferase domain-containing protein n=1 Tax=Lagenidium giganteum TaxID=4803 RepID=A0AAV2Z7V3_9STRA|nr:TPA: hypothetical protein N0F65_011380 [Lagenidium giganteum]
MELPLNATTGCVALPPGHRDPKFYREEACYTRAQVRQILVDLVFNMTLLLETHKLTYFLESGTLLGAFREGGVIRHDFDADLSIDTPSFVYLRDHVIDVPAAYHLAVYNNSATPDERDEKLPVRFIHKESALYVDVFEFLDWEEEATGKKMVGPVVSWCFFNCKGCELVPYLGRKLRVPPEWIYPVVDCGFEGRTLKCPRETQKYLTHMFGPDFMIPIDDH